MQSSRDDRGVVAEQAVACAEIFRQVAEMAVRDGVRLAVDDQQTRGVAAVGRLLGDEPVGQGVVEKVGLQDGPKVLRFSTGLEIGLLATFL